MTNLTEKWKNGELEDGFYYTQTGKDRIIAIDMYDKESNTWLLNSDKDMPPFEVLAPMPTYEELQELKECEKTIRSYNDMPIDYNIACETVNKLLDEKDKLKQEYARLKELLKKCQPYIKSDKEYWIQQGFWDAGKTILELTELLKNMEEALNLDIKVKDKLKELYPPLTVKES